jgi:hypothetical protein
LIPAPDRPDFKLIRQAGPCFKATIPPPRLSMKLQGLFPCTTPIIQKYYGIVIKNKILKIKKYYFNKI